MAIHTTFDEEKKIVTVRVFMETTPEEIIKQMKNLQESESRYNTIWDFTEAENYRGLTSEVMEKLLDIVEKMEARQGGKSAIVAPFDNTFGYGVLRQYQNLAECRNIPMDLQVFKSLAEATLWVESK